MCLAGVIVPCEDFRMCPAEVILPCESLRMCPAEVILPCEDFRMRPAEVILPCENLRMCPVKVILPCEGLRMCPPFDRLNHNIFKKFISIAYLCATFRDINNHCAGSKLLLANHSGEAFKRF
jgi:hypothetical protein